MQEADPPDHVVIVGASLAGLRTAEALRRSGHEGSVTLIGAEPHDPYTRPPLSKQVLDGSWEPERAALRPQEKLDALDLQLRLGTRAERLDSDAHVVHLDDGNWVEYDALVVATGCRPRRLPAGEGMGGVHVLRTIDDSLAIRAALEARPRVAVVGAGFIGLEVASVCRARGLEVTVLEGLDAPLVRGLGRRLGSSAGALHQRNGVDLRCGTGVDGFEGTDQVSGVVLSTGEVVPAELVVVGIGVVPNTEWLQGSGLELDDGVVCDETLAATGVEDVWAAGDVARWFHPTYGERVRFEHWTVAADHGAAVAANIRAAPGERTAHAPVPYVWSDQHGIKIQVAGRPDDEHQLDVVHGSLDDERFLAVTSADGAVTGAVGFGEPRRFMMTMMAMEDGPTTVGEVIERIGPV